MSESRAPARRPIRWVVGLVLLLVVAGAAFWAGRVTLAPPEAAPQAAPESSTVQVVEQDLGRVITLTTTVTRPSRPLAVNTLTGVVTEVAESGELNQGAVLYVVGGTPVVLVEGATPFWRELAEGVDGDDVAQVQQMLVDAGEDVDVNGEWGESTTSAARAWQEEQGFESTGGFPAGSLVASSTVPVSVSIDPAVAWPGGVLSGGEEVVGVAGGDPSFVMEVTQDQAALLPSGTQVSIQGPEVWDGVVADSAVTEDGLIGLTVTAPDGGLVCSDACGDVAASGSETLLTEVAIVPPVTGPVVPVAAVTVQPDGSGSVDVVGESGAVSARDVQVLAVADGLAVVDGVEVGETVRVFGSGDGQGGAVVPQPPADPQSPPDQTVDTPSAPDDIGEATTDAPPAP